MNVMSKMFEIFRRHPLFGRYFAAQAQSWVGSSITLVALPILVYQQTQSPALTAVLTTLEALPYLMFGLFAGALGDRLRRDRTLAGADGLNALLVGSLPAAALLGHLSIAHIFVVAVASATAGVFGDAANFGAVPALVGREDIGAATALTASVATSIGVPAPAVAGALVGWLGPAPILWLDAATFAIGSLLVFRMPLGGGDAAVHPGSVFQSMREGLTYIRHQPLVRALTLLGVGNSLAGGAVFGLLVVTIVQQQGLDDQDGRIGIFYAVAAGGSFVASAFLSRISKRVEPGRLAMVGLALSWTCLIVWANATNIALGLAALCAWQGMYTLVILNGIVVRQQLTPDHLQARVNTTARMIAWGGQPLGAAIAGVAAEAYGARVALLGCSLALGASLIGGMAAGVPSMVREPLSEKISAPPAVT